MDVVTILEKLQEFKLIKLNRIIGDWYSIYCPFHNNGAERRPSCGVLLHDTYRAGQLYPEGFFHCFTCSAAYRLEDAITKILDIHNISQSGLDWLVENIPGFEPQSDFEVLLPSDMIQNLSNKYAINQIDALSNSNKVESYVSESELASYRFTVPYMYERKLTDEIIEKYDIGYDGNWIPPGHTKPVPCITFPVRDISGRTLFLCRRSITGKLYNYPTGVTKPVYGIDMIQQNTKSVIICESCINALTAVSYGYDAVALMGTGNQLQIKQLRELGVSEYVLCLDGDEAGRSGARKLKAALKSVAIVWTINMPEGKDLNDCTQDEFNKLYAERE